MVSKKFRFQSLLIGLILVLTALPGEYARADVGVPPAHPGYSLSPGDFETNVQMVSEKVEIIIHEDPFKASVEASFQMLNNGAEDEEIEVWFPLGERKNYAKKERIIQVADFQVWADDIKKDIIIEHSDEWNLVWAHWTVNFPSETPVEILVSYKLSPSWDNSPPWYGRFDYILETGAGWEGVIETAEIIIQTPYPLGELDSLLGFGNPFYAKPSGYSLNQAEIKWIFNDLEPTEEDNINFSLLEPETWHSIYDSYNSLEISPDDWEAHETLARGLSIWMGSRTSAEYHGYSETTLNTKAIAELIGDSWKKVLDLSPPDALHYSYAFFFFRANPQAIEPYQLQNFYNEAIELYPDDEQIKRFYEWALMEGVIVEGAASISPTPPPPDTTDTPANPTEPALPAESPSPNNSLPISLIAGCLFIVASVVLIILAIKRGRVNESP